MLGAQMETHNSCFYFFSILSFLFLYFFLSSCTKSKNCISITLKVLVLRLTCFHIVPCFHTVPCFLSLAFLYHGFLNLKYKVLSAESWVGDTQQPSAASAASTQQQHQPRPSPASLLYTVANKEWSNSSWGCGIATL
jgi:hypothetical protein